MCHSGSAASRQGSVEIHNFWLGYAALIPIAVSIHYINEYADIETDKLAVRTPFSGGSGALAKTGLSPKILLTAAWTALIIGSVLALVFWLIGSLPLPALIVLSIGAFFGWMYSVPPLALAWRGWGELDNAALGGVVLPIFGYTVFSGQFDLSAFLAVLPFGMLVFVNLLATTWPDRKADKTVGKYTLATKWPVKWLRFVYWSVAASTFIVLPLLADWVLPPVVVWACLLTIPVVIWGAIAYTRQHSPLPTVAAMIVMLITHMLAWGTLIG